MIDLPTCADGYYWQHRGSHHKIATLINKIIHMADFHMKKTWNFPCISKDVLPITTANNGSNEVKTWWATEQPTISNRCG